MNQWTTHRPLVDGGICELRLTIDEELLRAVAGEAQREGITPQDYAREALVGRLAFDRGLQDGLVARLRED